MNKAFENILERLDSHIEDAKSEGDFSYINPFEIAKKAVQEVAEEYNNGWIPIYERLPDNDGYIMVSFSNYSIPDIARYEKCDEGGAFYPGDEEKSYSSYGLFVNAWQPLPEAYNQENNSYDNT